MRASPCVFSLILIFSGFFGCKDIPRDNPLDPKNPSSIRAQTVLIEAFVNTNAQLADSVQYNQNMLTALYQLQIKYDTKITVAVHHRNLASYQDPLAIFESEDVYLRYLQTEDEPVKGVPDVFINGSDTRIQGATTSTNALYRLETALQPLLIANSYFTIEPEVHLNNGTLSCKLTIARLGDSASDDILAKMLVLQDVGNQWERNAVRAMRRSNLIPEILPGDRKEISFSDVTGLETHPTRVVISVVSEDEYTIFQSIRVEL
jgi:hypothetical protein